MKLTAKAQEQLDKILEAFESGIVPEAIAKSILPAFDVPSSKWSLNNRILMFFAGTADARGIRQWKEIGRWPEKGSKAFCILVPIHGRKKEQDEDTGKESERQILVGFKCCPVFAVENTDGKPVEYPDLEPPEAPPLYGVAEAWNLNVKYLPGNEAYYGYYAPGRSEIGLSTHDAQTFFHELAHAAHHKVLGALKNGQHWQQEVTAELTAATLMHLYGQRPNDGYSFRYIRDYAEKAKKDVYRACMAVIADVGRCLELILNAAETQTAIPIAAD